MDIILFQVLLVLSVAVFAIPKSLKVVFAIVFVLLFAALTSMWAIEALLSGNVIYKSLAFEFWDKVPLLEVDMLSAVFILIINLTTLTAIIYSIGDLRPSMHLKSATSFSIHYLSYIWLHASMLLVVMLQEGLQFLLVWELMALSSFFLVIFDGEKETVLATGINYIIQMHIGFVLILIAFLMVKSETGTMSFHALGDYFSHHSNFLLFLIFFLGFGIKAGFIPLHSWLPRAHPAAPTHVSSLMSAVIIKMGIYGIFRVTSFVQADFLSIGLVILLISSLSGIFGVMMAIFQHDLKKLLAYHSIENIGIIGIGLGVGILGRYFENSTLTMLGFAGSILHVLNHSLFKSSLFFSVGNVYHATGTKNIEQLGGVVHHMPWTSTIFLISALAICGLPPFNGFISEFLIYSGVFQNLTHANFSNSFMSIASIISLALIGGLALFCFTKAFGVGFLGVNRSRSDAHFEECEMSMLLPGWIPVLLMVFIGFWPLPFFQIVQMAFVSFPFMHFSDFGTEPIDVTLIQIGGANLVFVLLTVVLLILRWSYQRNATLQYGPTWGCGYTAGDFKHQYTSTSYANNLRELVHPFILFKRVSKKIKRTDIFPSPRTFETHVDDKIEWKGLLPPIHWMKKVLPKAGLAQTGNIHHYLLYPVAFMIIIALLSYLKWL